MKLKTLFVLLTTTTSFIASYFLDLTLDNLNQYLALVGVVFIDGFFGVLAGIKREGFKTHKALRVLKRAFGWIVILTMVLMVEKGFEGAGWLSETIIVPFVIIQIVSALKNASMAGFISSEELNILLSKIDKHKEYKK